MGRLVARDRANLGRLAPLSYSCRFLDDLGVSVFLDCEAIGIGAGKNFPGVG